MSDWTVTEEERQPEDLWTGLVVRFYSATGPGYPNPESQSDPFHYDYRTLASRWPLPRPKAETQDPPLSYGVTVGLDSKNPDDDVITRLHSYPLGATDRWKGRPSATTRAAAFDALVLPDGGADREDIARARAALDFEAAEEYGYDDHVGGAPPGSGPTTWPVPTVGYAADYWQPGVLVPADLPGQYDLAVDSTSIYFEGFAVADLVNYKVTTDPTYDAEETSLPKIKPGTKFNQQVYIMLAPQWWHWTIEYDLWAAYNWTSPDHRIGQLRPLHPEQPIADLRGEPGAIEAGSYTYWMTCTTSAGESMTGLLPSSSVVVADPLIDGQVYIQVPFGPEGTTARTLYRTEASTPTVKALLVVIPDNDDTSDFIDNTPNASLGAAAPTFYPVLFGLGRLGDYFLLPVAMTDFSGGGAGVSQAAGLYWCSNPPGDTWADWDFCAITDYDNPDPDPACFPCDLTQARQGTVDSQHFTISGFKQALIRPVFPAESAPYSDTAIDPHFETPTFSTCSYAPFTESTGSNTTDHYESLLIPGGDTATAEQIRVLCAWAENSHPYNDAVKTVTFAEVLALVIAADASFDPDNVDGDSVIGGPFSYWTANGKITVTRSDTPVGSLVAAVSVNGVRRYVWRRTATTGRTGAIVTAAAYDSIQDRYSMTELGLTATDPAIPRRFIRSASGGP